MDELPLPAKLEYLGLDEDDLEGVTDPFGGGFMADPARHVLRLMMNPEYFYFTCKMLFDIELAPFQCVLLKEMWNHPFPMLIGSRGMGKSTLLGLYALLRAIFIQGRKIVITGAGFRQAKTVYQYAENVWHQSPILQSLFADNPRSGPHHDPDRWMLQLGDSQIIAIPIGDGSRIRGQRAHDLLVDEFASASPEIFETVISGFSVVSLSPVKRAQEKARIRLMKKLGRWDEGQAHRAKLLDTPNQTIISGTGYWQFNHFCTYWKRWKGIVESGGEEKRLRQLLGDQYREDLDWRDYCVIRMPVESLPEGYYDEKQLARSKATIHTGIYANEFGALFSSDSNGFFKRTLVESCVTTSPIPVPGEDEPVQFRAALRGRGDCRYVMGVDPASEHDNFSIVVLELHGTHRRVVYCWTTDKQRFKAKVESRFIEEKDYYGHCARKIRDLMKLFPCDHVAMDSQGGGYAVMEALHDPDKLREGEQLIWPITTTHPLSDGKDRGTDEQPGLHVVELVSFAKADWVAEANHGMRKDFEDRVLLFPKYDPVMLQVAFVQDQAEKRIFDTLEDCVTEIEELKDELATIHHDQTPGTFRDKWDTPEVKLEGSKKGRLRKDRYSSLLMANAAARRMDRRLEMPAYEPIGGFAGHLQVVADDAPMYSHAPDWLRKASGGSYDGYGLVGVSDS